MSWFTQLVKKFTSGSVLFGDSNGSVNQDNANFYWDNVNKRFLLGTNVTQPATFYVKANTTAIRADREADSAFMVLGTYEDTTAAAPSRVNVRRARGTISVPTGVLDGDHLGQFDFGGYDPDGAAFESSASITGIADGNWGAANRGQSFMFRTTANGSTTLTERMRLLSSGHLRFEELTTDPGTTVLASLAQFCIYMKNNKFVIAFNNAGTITYISIPMDGATTTWTQSTVAP